MMIEFLVYPFICLVIYALVGGACLYFAGQITGIDCYFLGMVMVIGAASLAEIPFLMASVLLESFWLVIIGWLASLIVFLVLLVRFTKASVFPDLILMIVVYKLSTLVLGTALM